MNARRRGLRASLALSTFSAQDGADGAGDDFWWRMLESELLVAGIVIQF